MGKFYTKTMATIAEECQELLHQFVLDVSDSENKKFTTTLNVTEKYIRIGIQAKVIGRKQSFGRFVLKVSDVQSRL